MQDSTFYEDDSTQPLQPRSPNTGQDQQGKLVIGSFQNPPPQRNRTPYQNPLQQPPRQGQPGQQQSRQASGQPQYPAYQQPPAYSQQARQNVPYQQPAPPAQNYPNVPPGGASPQGTRRSRPRRRRTGCLAGCLIVLVLLCVLGALSASTLQKVMAFGSAISTQPPLTSQTNYMTGADRVNLLVMGYGGGTHPGADLTDSMMVMSLLPSNSHTTLLSVPRDLWVQIPEGSGNYGKINATYEFGSNNGQNPVAGGNAAAAKVSLVTGLDVRYWLTINFNGFKDFINSIGGIDVYVPDSFNACYPKNDDPTVNASWIKVQFNKGMQHMDGATAIEYARAREPLAVCGMGTSENQAELTDFARSARQQIIMKGALSKLKQMSTWPKLYAALDALQKTVYTNMSLADLARFALVMDLTNAHHVGLSNQNVLVDSTSSDGQYILAPANNNWQAIKDYVQKNLYN
jgi:LCP family protein required for cell wall assembly